MSPLIENILKISTTDHLQIQWQIRKILQDLGFEAKTEKKLLFGDEKKGKIDVYGEKDNYSVGVEVDHSVIRKKSVEKLNTLNPSLAIFVLKAKKLKSKEIYSRAKSLKVKTLLIHLAGKKVERIAPKFSKYEQVAKPRFRKFERTESPSKFKITETDLKILQELADYRFLDSNHISALHPEVHQRTLQRRLHFLFHAGFLEKPIYQFSQYQAPSYVIYTLGKKGAELLFSGEGIRVSWFPKSKTANPLFLQHSLMISNFRVILNLALEKKRGSKLVRWRTEGLAGKVYSKGEQLPLSPDAFFTIEDKNDWLHYFLEADRSRMTDEKFFDKMRGYWEWWKEEGHKNKLNISVFRVLTITISEERKENLRLMTKQADDSRQGSNMFLFTCEKNYNLDEPETILKPIWQSPKNEDLHHLLE